MISEKQLNSILENPQFRSFAQRELRDCGINVPPGEDPSVVLILSIHQHAPEAVEQFLAGAASIDQQQRTAKPTEPDEAARMQRLGQALPVAKVLESWKKLSPAARAKMQSPQVEAFAQQALAKIGAGPLPGLTAGETVAAYMHGINTLTPLPARAELFQSLAKATRGAFGNADELRGVAAVLQKAHTEGEAKAETERFAQKLGDRIAVRDAERAKGRSRIELAPAERKKALAEEAQKTESIRSRRNGTRDAMAEVAANQKAVSGPRKATYNDRERLAMRMAYSEKSGEPMDDVDLSPDLRREVVRELRDEGNYPASGSTR